MPVSLETLPLPVPSFFRPKPKVAGGITTTGIVLKVAVHVQLDAGMVKLLAQGEGDHPANVEPEFGVAVKVTVAPLA